MQAFITTKKFSTRHDKPEDIQAYRSICAEEKNAYSKSRYFKSKRKTKRKLTTSFKKHWFCCGCCSAFSLKPIKRYKTLLEFPLVCPRCHSVEVAHNSNLTKAIHNKNPINTLLLYASSSEIEIECEIDSFLKYPLEFISGTQRGKLTDFSIVFS